jgi:hypothetical protein
MCGCALLPVLVNGEAIGTLCNNCGDVILSELAKEKQGNGVGVDIAHAADMTLDPSGLVITNLNAIDCSEGCDLAKEAQILRDHIKKIAACHCCNDCGKAGRCRYEPKVGEICAINCPLWREIPQPVKDASTMPL